MFLLEEFPLPLIFFRFSFYVRRVILQFFFACHSSFWGRTWSLSSLIRVIANYYILYFIIILLVSNSHITLQFFFNSIIFLGGGPAPLIKYWGAATPLLPTPLTLRDCQSLKNETLGKDQPTFPFKKVFCITLAVGDNVLSHARLLRTWRRNVVLLGKFQSFLITF